MTTKTIRPVPAKLLAEARKHWVAACEYDGIPADTSFAVFSKDNPHVTAYQKAMVAVLRRGR